VAQLNGRSAFNTLGLKLRRNARGSGTLLHLRKLQSELVRVSPTTARSLYRATAIGCEEHKEHHTTNDDNATGEIRVSFEEA
jgi:hypothetical protein